MSSNYNNFEVLVKFDSDDKKVNAILPKIETYPFTIKYLIEPRGRGYIDLHIYYNRLFSLVDERSVVIGAMADDFEVTQKGWDEIVLSKTSVFQDQIFIIHGRPHPPNCRENYQEQKFFLNFDISRLDDIAIIDEAPMWSRKLLDICGGLGHLSFTDAWTLMLEYYLFHRCSMNRTIFLDQPIIHRRVNEQVDTKRSPRWWTDRANNFAFAESNFYNTLVEQQALNIYSIVKVSELSLLPPPMGNLKFDIVIKKIEFPPKELSFYHRLRQDPLNFFPGFLHSGLSKLISILKSIRNIFRVE